jgi:hypothetical protein
MRMRIGVLLIVGLTLTIAGTNGDRAAAQTPVDQSPLLVLIPDAGTAPAPAWLRQGIRMTYYSASASVRGARHYYTQDPNGNWIDPDTGQRYSQGDVASASGHGFTQLTLVYVDQSVAVVDARSYGLQGLAASSPRTLLGVAGFVGLPGVGGDFWIQPLALARAVGLQARGTKVVRMPYTLAGRQFRAIWLETRGDTNYSSWVFDEDTGILLHSGTSTQGAPIQGPVAQGDSRAGSTILGQNTLLDTRTITRFWTATPSRRW